LRLRLRGAARLAAAAAVEVCDWRARRAILAGGRWVRWSAAIGRRAGE